MVTGQGLPPVFGMADTGAVLPSVTAGSTPPDAVPPSDDAPSLEGAPVAESTPPVLPGVVPAEPVEPVAPLVAVVVPTLAVVPDAGDVTGEPLAVPELAEGGAAVTVTTPQVGVVWPAATSLGVRSPQEYAACSAAVGATAPGTFFWTALTPYCSSDKPRLA